MPQVSVQSNRKSVFARINKAKRRNVIRWGPNLEPEWGQWVGVDLDGRIDTFSGKSNVIHSNFKSPTPVVLLKGRTHVNADLGIYYSIDRTYGKISRETKSDNYAVYNSNMVLGTSTDPRSSNWNIGGYLSLARFLPEYNILAGKLRKKMADPIVDLGMIGAEAVKTVRSFQSIAVDLLHVLKFVKHGDVLGAVKVAFGNTNINAISRRDLGPIRRRVKTRTGKQWIYVGRDGKRRSEAELRAMHPAKRWLEYSFGVAPVIQDVQKLAELEAGLYKNPVFKFRSVYERDLDANTLATFRMLTRVDLIDVMARYNQQLGLHATQVYALAWELVPLSWLLDYVIDIGGMLSMMSSSVGFRHLSSHWSLRLECKDAVNRGGTKSGASETSFSNLMSYDYYERNTIAGGIPIPTHPRLFKVLGSRIQQYNLLAFVTMAFSGHIDKRVTNLG